jgi:hypothetical protein
MKALRVILLLMLSTVCLSGTEKLPDIHKYTHVIGQHTVLQGNKCSATAIGPHALLTASHCELPTRDLGVDGRKATIVSFARDENDHTIYLLSGIEFKDFADVDESPLTVGEDLFMYGNPGELDDIFRKGYVSKVDDEDDPPYYYIDINTFFGDSGSGLFNRDGKLVAVLSTGEIQTIHDVNFELTGAFGLNFSKDVLDTAKKF